MWINTLEKLISWSRWFAVTNIKNIGILCFGCTLYVIWSQGWLFFTLKINWPHCADTALPLIKETLKSLLKETKRDHLLKQKETIKRPFIQRKETFNFFMRYLDKMQGNCGKNVHCEYLYQLSKFNIYRNTKLY